MKWRGSMSGLGRTWAFCSEILSDSHLRSSPGSGLQFMNPACYMMMLCFLLDFHQIEVVL